MSTTINNGDRLFSDQELDNLEGNLFAEREEDKETVKCLGKEFESDDARREYFRAELRKKLPELRQIEGFPIGEDDDIIALSDPPYYTACPNPWLNDFIAQWESEKADLEAQGLRTPDFQVTEPYAADVSEGKNNPIYNSHGYHTKVPHPAIMRYILHYTQPGDIVFDGFCGSGMTGVAAQLCGSKEDVNALNAKGAKIGVRHSICSDLSPIASLIAAGYNLKFDPEEFERKAKAILNQVDKELGWMYETKVNGQKATANYYIWSDVFSCPSCGKEIVLWDIAVSEDTKAIKSEFDCPHCGHSCTKLTLQKVWETKYDNILRETVRQIKSEPVRVNYTLNGKRGEKKIEDFNMDIFKCTENTSYKFLTLKLPIGEKTKSIWQSNRISHTHQFYTHRNFVYLSRIYELAKDDVFLLTWFTSTLQNMSRMYKFRTDRKGGILNGTLYIPSLNIEQNPKSILTRKLSDFVKMSYIYRGNNILNVASATALDKMPSNEMDYIFVDPPFGANIMYSELNSLWEGWLRVRTDNKDEAIINNSQQKGLFEYQQLMNASLKEFYRVLKPGKWMTVEFSNTSAAVWNSIQNALQGVGFVVVNIAALDKKQGSFNAVSSTTAVKQDLVITCFKPSEKLTVKMADRGKAKENVWDFVDEYLEHLPVHLEREQKTTTVVERSAKILFDRMISYYVVHGMQVPMDARDFQKGLRERYAEIDGMFFTGAQAQKYQEKKREYPEVEPMGLIVNDEANGIEWLKNLLREGPKQYNEIQPEWMKALQGQRKGDKIPELADILAENFIAEKDREGKERWRLVNIRDDKDVEAIRTRALLREFAHYVERAKKPREKFKDGVRVEALRAGFKQCYIDKDFKTIVELGDRIPQNLLTEDEVLLQFYDIAQSKL